MDALTTGGNLLLIILGFCLLIALHELGHFLAARWAGIRVHAFAIGMGPVVLGYRRGVGLKFGSTDREVRTRHGKSAAQMSDRELAQHALGETEYSLRLLPLGGFVGMLGQDDLDPAARSEDPRSYQRTPIGKRMVVVSAGVVANLILAVVLFIVAFMVGVRFEAPVIGALPSTSPALAAEPLDAPGLEPGLRPGDRVLEIDGARMLTFADIRIAAAMSRPGVPLTMLVERPGHASPLQFRVEPRNDPRGGVRTLAVLPSANCTITTDRSAESLVKRALDEAGLGATELGPGWVLEQIDGTTAISGDALVTAARSLGGRPIPTRWRSPDGSRSIDVEIPVTPELQWPGRREGATSEGDAGLLGLLPLAQVLDVDPTSANASAIWPGDVVLRAADSIGPSQRSLISAIRERGSGFIALTLLRDGAEIYVSATIAAAEIFGDRPARLGLTLAPALSVPLLAAPAADGAPASNLGILPLSRVQKVAGTTVENWSDLRRALDAALRAALARPGAGDDPSSAIVVPIELSSPTAAREVRSLELRVPRADADAILSLGWTPTLSLAVFDPLDVTLTADGNPIRAVAMGFRQTWRLVQLTYLTLDRLLRGTVAVKELHGPVGIVHIGTRVADRGFMYLVFFLAMISVNLAVLNFLPLPIVDGGLFLFLIYEKLRGKPPSVAFQNAATILGLCLIVGVFLVASYNDVLRLFGRG